MTLLDCAAVSTRGRAFGPPSLTYEQHIDSEFVLIGIGLSDREQACFEALELEIENLSQWSAETDIDLRFEWTEAQPPVGGRVRQRLRRLIGQQPTGPQPTRSSWGIRAQPADAPLSGTWAINSRTPAAVRAARLG